MTFKIEDCGETVDIYGCEDGVLITVLEDIPKKDLEKLKKAIDKIQK